MAKVMLSIHGGRGCDKYCRWNPQNDIFDFGQEDYHMIRPAGRSAIAIDEFGHLLGVWSYDRERKGVVRSCGTWVSPKHRKRGLAKKLWKFVIAHENIKKIYVSVITDRGYSLVEALKRDLPDMKWKITEDGDRRLRKL